jgi:hypothetical protein
MFDGRRVSGIAKALCLDRVAYCLRSAKLKASPIDQRMLVFEPGLGHGIVAADQP